MAKKKRKYYSGKELLCRRQLERQQAEAEEKGRRNKRSTLFAAWLHSDYNGSSCTA